MAVMPSSAQTPNEPGSVPDQFLISRMNTRPSRVVVMAV
jgi:hypothetical protein